MINAAARTGLAAGQLSPAADIPCGAIPVPLDVLRRGLVRERGSR